MGHKDGPHVHADMAHRSVVMVIRTSYPMLAWQWVSRYKIDGILYGELDAKGQLTGPNITFIYPDFQTGLRGTFNNGQLVSGIGVRLTAHRCHNGLMEIRTKPFKHDTGLPAWHRESFPGQYLRVNAQRMDPFERRAVYAAQSQIPGANEGIFAKRHYLPGQLISYFIGQLTTEANILFDNQTTVEYDEARSYFFNLGSYTPNAWGLSKFVVIDIPVDMRTLANFRTTLTHKVNHKVSKITNLKLFYSFFFFFSELLSLLLLPN
jgi:histone-lysine N-methyltransferase SETD7